jgi:hypothetical protein
MRPNRGTTRGQELPPFRPAAPSAPPRGPYLGHCARDAKPARWRRRNRQRGTANRIARPQSGECRRVQIPIKSRPLAEHRADPSSPPPRLSSSESAESLFALVLKPFSTASAKNGHRYPNLRDMLSFGRFIRLEVFPFGANCNLSLQREDTRANQRRGLRILTGIWWRR